MRINPLPKVEHHNFIGDQYHYEREVNLKTSTDGLGYWSKTKKDVRIIKLDLSHYNDNDNNFELRAYWDKRTWNTGKHGLIYTDKLWLTTFKKSLIDLSFSKNCLKSVSYSEQGMQGNDYVSMDVYPDLWRFPSPDFAGFAKEYENILYSVKERFLGSLVKM